MQKQTPFGFIWRNLPRLRLSVIGVIGWVLMAVHTLAVADSAQVKYVCPMHPQIVRDHPGTCPICGMALVKQQIAASTQTQPMVSMTGGKQGVKMGTQQSYAIRVAKVQRLTLWKYIETYGVIQPDETRVVHIHPYASGWISDLAVRDNGAQVTKGQLLYRIYSPEMVSAQQDLVLAVKNVRQVGKGASPLLASARTRLKLLGFSAKTIRQIERTQKVIHQVPVYAPQSGVVGQLSIQPGMYVQPMNELMSLSDLTKVWAIAEVLPLQQRWVAEGKTVEVASPAMLADAVESQIDYIYPNLDAKTRTLKVRIPLENTQNDFLPNLPVSVTIYGGPHHNALVVPRAAIIDDGKMQRVVKQVSPGQYQVAEVKVGMISGDYAEILSGLSEGEAIVISGQFLLDSESQIQQNLQKLMAPKPVPEKDEGFQSLNAGEAQ